jgi:adenosine deaminase
LLALAPVALTDYYGGCQVLVREQDLYEVTRAYQALPRADQITGSFRDIVQYAEAVPLSTDDLKALAANGIIASVLSDEDSLAWTRREPGA